MNTEMELRRRITKKQNLQSKMKPVKISSVEDKGSPENHKCPCCEKSFATKPSLNSHMKIHCNERQLNCSICDKVFKYPSHLKYHNEIIHLKLKPHCCSMCDKKFSVYPDLNSHMRVHTREKPYICRICSADFISPSNLKRHVASHFEDRNYNCSLCEKTFKTIGSRSNHIRLFHSDVRPYQCGFCDEAFKTNSDKKRHEQLIHIGGRPYQCSFCKKKFTTKGNKKMHERVHSKEKPYNCSLCEKSFRFSSNRNRHEKSHTAGESLPNKKVCNNPPKTKASTKTSQGIRNTSKKSSPNTSVIRSFATRGIRNKGVASYMASQSEDRNYKCPLCEKSFKTALYKRKHIQMCHINVPTFKCNFCDKAFKTNANQSRHENMIHSGDRPYKCSLCIKKFTTEECKKKHEMIHANEIFYNCSFCEKSFRISTNKTRHEKIHSIEKSFQQKKVFEKSHKTKAITKTSEETRNTSKKLSPRTSIKRSPAAHEKSPNVEKCVQNKKEYNNTTKTKANVKTSEGNHMSEKLSSTTFVKRSSTARMIRKRRVAKFFATKRFYSCTTCLKYFVTYEKLISHRRTHKILRPCRIIVLRFA